MSPRQTVLSILLSLALNIAVVPVALPKPTVSVKVESGQSGLDANETVWKFGGGVWHTPLAIDWVESQMDVLRRPGVFRASIGWEVLAASENLDDVKRKLASYPLNGFLQRMRTKGAEVIICFDAMPRWLARDPSNRKLADGPAWAKSPPRNYAEWSRVVEEVVRHFNGNLKLNAYYEVWNEPDHAWAGSSAEYFLLYKASAEGALKADAKAKLGGPALSDWMSSGTARDQDQSTLFLRRFFDFVAANPLLQYKRTHLPLAFVSWHRFYGDPQNIPPLTGKLRLLLSEAGLPSDTPLFIDEWNIAAEPPYPEGDLNATHFGAAYVASSLLSMASAGVDRQVFQMIVDPGAPGYSGGAFSIAGLPRSNWLAFRLFDKIAGQQHPISVSHEWVRATAFENADAYFLITSVLVPTERMMLQSLFERLVMDFPEAGFALRKFDKSRLIDYVKGSEQIPNGLSEDLADQLRNLHQRWKNYRAEKQRWAQGITVEFALPGARLGNSATRYLIDAAHTIEPRALEQAGHAIQAELKDTKQRVAARFERAATPEPLQNRFAEDLRLGLKLNQETLNCNPEHAGVLRENQRDVRESYERVFKRQLAKIATEPRGEILTLAAGIQTLTFDLDMAAVQLLIIKKRAR